MTRILFFALAVAVLAGNAKSVQAEGNTYDPLATGTYYTLKHRQEMKEAGLGQSLETQRRLVEHDPERLARQIVIDKQYRARYPDHPGQYRDAYARGGFRQTKDADFYGW